MKALGTPEHCALCGTEPVWRGRPLRLEVDHKLGRRDNTRQRHLVRQWLAEEGITTSHFLGQAHQRGRPAPTPTRRPEDLLVKHDGRRRTKTSLLRRALSEVGVPE